MLIIAEQFEQYKEKALEDLSNLMQGADEIRETLIKVSNSIPYEEQREGSVTYETNVKLLRFREFLRVAHQEIKFNLLHSK